MGNAWLKDAISKVADTVENVTVAIEDISEKAVELLEAVSVKLEQLDDELDRVLNDEQAQPAAQSAPVEEVSLKDKVDYVYEQVAKTVGFTTEKARVDFKSALYHNPTLTDSVYEQYQNEAGR